MKPASMLPLSFIVVAIAASPLHAQLAQLGALVPDISTMGSFSIVPRDAWSSGDFMALSDSLFGDPSTPRDTQMRVSMDQTASTTYEGDLFLKKLRLKLGLNVDIDNNFIGKLDRLMGYVNYDGFTLRVQTSTLRGTANWSGSTVLDMPTQSAFDNSFVGVDLLYYRQTGGIDYFGIGYTSYHLPVQLDCLVYSPAAGQVAKGIDSYQDDMSFQIYSILFGLDTLRESFTRTGTFASMQGLSLWMATQDRAGAGLSYISDKARSWVEAANGGRRLWSATQIAMLVDYNLTVGLQWVRSYGPVRLGLGLGYNLGGQVVLCITPKGPVDDVNRVDASPSFYLFHSGPIFTGTISW